MSSKTAAYNKTRNIRGISIPKRKVKIINISMFMQLPVVHSTGGMLTQFAAHTVPETCEGYFWTVGA